MFRKQVQIKPSDQKMGYDHNFITLGSCFSDSIGEKLKISRFNVQLNPFGTIFHPLALASVFDGLNENDIVERDNYFFNWQLGGSHFDLDRDQMVEKVNQINTNFQVKLRSANVVAVTFGTAWGYVLKNSNKVVANCHKIVQEQFDKKLFSVDEIVGSWKSIVTSHPNVQFVFTVSPVRHWKDGVRENNVSKGVLHLVVDELLKESNVSYFPAYEILLDELRDYRFYASDLLHPSEEAVEYIWQKFRETYFDSRTNDLVNKVEKLEASKKHKLMYPESVESRKFLNTLEKQEKEIERLLSEFQA